MKSINDFYDALERASNNKINDVNDAKNDYVFSHGRYFSEWDVIELERSDTQYLMEELDGFPDELLLEMLCEYKVNLTDLYVSPEIEDYLNKSSRLIKT